MDAPQPHLHRGCGSSDIEAVDHGLVYRLGVSVLNNLPIYSRLRSNSFTGHKADGKASSPIGGMRTPLPGYYDGSVLTEVKGGREEEESMCSSTSAKLGPKCGSTLNRFSSQMRGTSSTVVVVEDTPSECSSGGTSTPTSGYFPDTGMKRFFKSFGSLLKTLGSEAPAADMISSWLPNVLGVLTPVLEESSGGVTPPLAAGHGHHTVVTGYGECGCFQCFQQQQKLYHLWLQNRSQKSRQSTPQQHLLPQQTICMSCQQQVLPPQDSKSLLHRFTAALVLQIFTFVSIIYPYVKALFLASYAWERHNHITERVLTAIMVVSERAWLWTLWLFDGGAGGVGPQEWRRGEVNEQRVRKWIMKVSGEVLGGLVDGMQVGMNVWGVGGKGKGEGRMMAIE